MREDERVEMTERQRELRDAFVEVRGYWSDSMQSLLELDPDFFAAYLNLSAVPWRTGRLEPKVKELIYIAVDGAATHLYAPGSRQHIQLALEHGATKEELLEVLQLDSTLGIHACTVGVPILQEELAAAGRADPKPLSARQERMKADFTAKRGYWNTSGTTCSQLDAEFFAAYTAFSSYPGSAGRSSPRCGSSSTRRSTPRRRTSSSRGCASTSNASPTARRRRRSWRCSRSPA